MTVNEVMACLSSKGWAPNLRGNFIDMTCPTCPPGKSGKKKRYLNLANRSSNCWICQRYLTWRQLLGANPADFDGVVPEAPRECKPMALPYTEASPLSVLPDSHPARQMFAKDELTNWAYYDRLGIVWCRASTELQNSKGRPYHVENFVFFPLYADNALMAWQARLLGAGDKFRYLTMGLGRGKYLWNGANCLDYQHIVVFEGVKKALKLANGVATLGKGITNDQIKSMLAWPKITLFLDQDAQAEGERLAGVINLGGRSKCRQVKYVEGMPDNPDDMPSEQVAACVADTWK